MRRAGRSFDVFHNGRKHTFLPGQTVPDEIAAKVKNPKVWQARGAVLEETASVSDNPNPEDPSVSGEDDMEEFDEDGDVDTDAGSDGNEEGENGGDNEDGDDLEATMASLNVKQLTQLADEMGVDRKGLTKRADLEKAIREHGSL